MALLIQFAEKIEDGKEMEKEAQPIQVVDKTESGKETEKEAQPIQVANKIEDGKETKKEAQPIQVVDSMVHDGKLDVGDLPRVGDRIEDHKMNGTDHDTQPTKPPLEEVCTNPEQGEVFRPSLVPLFFLSL